MSADRGAMKLVVKTLNEGGFDIKIVKKDDGEELRRKAGEALASLITPALQKTIESIDPAKLQSVLKLGCNGIYVDLKSESCTACPDAAACISEFIENVKAEFKGLQAVMSPVEGEKTEPKAKNNANFNQLYGDSAKKPDEKKARKPPGSNRMRTNYVMAPPYDPERLVFIMDVENPAKEGDPVYSTQKAILEEVPGTLGALREIVEREWKYQGKNDDERFMRDWCEDLREFGVLKLDEDLSKEDKKFYRKHGIKV